MPFAGWEMPVTYEGIREEHSAVRTPRRDVRRLAHGRGRGRGARARSPSCSGCSPTTSPRSRSAAPSTRASANEDGGVLDDLFAYRLGGDRYLIVTNAANHEADLAWLGRWSRGFDVDRPRRRRPLRDARRPGPARPRDRSPRRSGSSCRRGCTSPHVQVGRRPALVCGTGYTGEDGVELLIDPEVAPPIWAELLDAGVVPCGLGARDTLRLEVCFPLHGNDLDPGAQPDRGRPRLVLRGGDRLRRLRGGRRAPAPRARPRSWRRS